MRCTSRTWTGHEPAGDPILNPFAPIARKLESFSRHELQASAHNKNFVLGLTGIRALAAMMVFLHHLFALAGPRILSLSLGDVSINYHILLTAGWMGANVFFVLSGFLLALPFIARSPSPVSQKAALHFLWRRVRRVVPAYWVQISVLAAISIALGAQPDARMVFAHLFFLQNFSQDYAFQLNGVYWTLPTEFGFYLILPLLAWLAYRMRRDDSRSWVVLGAVMVVFGICWRAIVFLGVSDSSIGTRVFKMLQLPGLVDQFGIGILFAWCYVRSRQIEQPLSGRNSDALTILGLLGTLLVMVTFELVFEQYWDGHPFLFLSYTLMAVFMGAFILGTAAGSRVSRWIFGNSVAVFLGLISYSIYLWHFPVLLWTMKLLDDWQIAGDRIWWLAGLAIPSTIFVAAMSYWWIERPFMLRNTR